RGVLFRSRAPRVRDRHLPAQFHGTPRRPDHPNHRARGRLVIPRILCLLLCASVAAAHPPTPYRIVTKRCRGPCPPGPIGPAGPPRPAGGIRPPRGGRPAGSAAPPG